MSARQLLLALPVLLLSVGPARAQFTWNVDSGSFQSASSWTPAGGPPGAGSTAQFTNGGTVLATFGSDWQVGTLTVNTGTTTFGMNGHTLAVGNLNFGTAAQTANWTITNGTLSTTDPSVTFGSVGNANATLTLDASKLLLTASGLNLAGGASTSVATVVVGNGSLVTANGATIGASGTGTLTVTGVGSEARFSGGTTFGNLAGAVGTVQVLQGGLLTTSGNVPIGNNASATGTVTLSGPGSTWTHTNGTLGTGAGAGTLTIGAGTTLTATGLSNAAHVFLADSDTVTVNGTLTVGGTGASGIIVGGTTTASTFTVGAGAAVTTKNLTRADLGNISLNGGSLTVRGGTFDHGGNSLVWNQGTLQLTDAATATGLVNLTYGGGSVIVSGGSTLTATGGITLTGQNAVTRLTVDGAGSRVDPGTVLTVGSNGAGVGSVVTVQNGGTFTSTSGVTVGSSSAGNVTVTGAGSRFSAGTVNVAVLGVSVGTLTASAGGTVSGTSINLATFAGSTATATVTGAGSTLTSANGLFIGGAGGSAGGTGSLTVSAGGAVVVTGETKTWGGGTLTIDGGSLTTSSYTRLGTLDFRDGTFAVSGGAFSNGASATALTLDGAAAGSLPTLQLTAATNSNTGALTVANTRQAAMTLAGGSVFAASTIQIGSALGSSGTVTVTGGGTQLNSAGTFRVGSTFGGAGTLTLSAGGRAAANDLFSLNPAGTLNLTGGTLSLAPGVGLFLNGGIVNWTSGTLALDGGRSLVDASLTTLLGADHVLGTGKTIQNTAGVPSMALSGSLTVAGGTLQTGQLTNAATLAVSAGSVDYSNFTFTNNVAGVVALSGTGRLGGTSAPLVNDGELLIDGAAARITGTTLTNAGRLSGNGRIDTRLINTTNGTVIADAGQRLHFAFGDGGVTPNANNANGTIALNGGTVDFTNGLTNASGGLISGRGTIRGGTPGGGNVSLVNAGSVAFTGGFSDVHGKVQNNSGGRIVTGGGGITTFHDDVTHNGTEIHTAAGSRTVFLGAQSGAGPFTGTGTVENLGDLRPGNSPANVTYAGNLVLGASAKTFMELGGTTPGTQHDKLSITGQLSFGGTLDVQYINSFQAQPGDSFHLFGFGSSGGGTFSQINLPNLASGASWDLGTLYTNGIIVVQPVPEPATVLAVFLAGAGGWHAWRRRRAS